MGSRISNVLHVDKFLVNGDAQKEKLELKENGESRVRGEREQGAQGGGFNVGSLRR